ncbi:MAG: hypothetical protein VXW31_02460, partial [Planctomycetota bacterium]|nr:hypothetical protein [Planctomycetota bacterium]
LTEATDEGARITVFPHEHSKGALLVAVQETAAASPWELSSVSVDRGRMDDVFRTVTTASAGA